jgi:ADP-heptose:LPS heptosyltransferase
LKDFADTAGLIAEMDMVIAVDTAVAHLAGATGKPVWVLLHTGETARPPEWRWLLNRDDSPWYPTMRLYRQTTPGDWTTPIERLANDLQAVLSEFVKERGITD